MTKFPEFVLLKQTSLPIRYTQKPKLTSAANWENEKVTAKYKFPQILVLRVSLHLWDQLNI